MPATFFQNVPNDGQGDGVLCPKLTTEPRLMGPSKSTPSLDVSFTCLKVLPVIMDKKPVVEQSRNKVLENSLSNRTTARIGFPKSRSFVPMPAVGIPKRSPTTYNIKCPDSFGSEAKAKATKSTSTPPNEAEEKKTSFIRRPLYEKKSETKFPFKPKLGSIQKKSSKEHLPKQKPVKPAFIITDLHESETKSSYNKINIPVLTHQPRFVSHVPIEINSYIRENKDIAQRPKDEESDTETVKSYEEHSQSSPLSTREMTSLVGIWDHGKPSHISGWLNMHYFKCNTDIIRQMATINFKLTEDEIVQDNMYKFDSICPKLFRCKVNAVGADRLLSLENSYMLTKQSRRDCLGAAIFCRLLEDHRLSGDVVYTNITEKPQQTAYLANLLSVNKKIKKLLVFGLANRMNLYKRYFKDFNIQNVELYDFKFVDLKAQNKFVILKDAIAVLTSQFMLDYRRNEDIRNITKTEIENSLKLSMEIPKIQIILFETNRLIDLKSVDDLLVEVLYEKNKATREDNVLRVQRAKENGITIYPDTSSDEEWDYGGNLNTRKGFMQVPPWEIFVEKTISSNLRAMLRSERVFLSVITREVIATFDDTIRNNSQLNNKM